MHPLLEQIRRVGRRAHRLLLLRSMAWCASLLLAVSFVVGCLDYWFRFDEQGMRWLATSCVAAVAVWSAIRFLWPAWRFRGTEEATAQWVEARFPDLRDRLSSAVSFLRQPTGDARFGSSSLRQGVIEDITRAIANRNLLECLDTRAARRAGLTLFLVVGTVMTVSAMDVQSSTLAARRLVMPWRHESWPRRHWLAFHNPPRKLAAGQEFMAEVVATRGWLPSEVTIWYWFDGDDESEARPHRMIYAGGRMTHRLSAVTRSFRYRAVGGDDWEMSWRRVDVVEPPRVIEAEVTMRPPAYSGLPIQSSDHRIYGLAGTAVQISGRVNKPIQSAEIHFSSGKLLRRIPAKVNADGRSFQLPGDSSPAWLLEQSGTYGWALLDREGVAGPVTINSEVDVLPDAPPTVAIESPLPGNGYTAGAEVPLRVLVKDDLAVQRVLLKYGEQSVTLMEKPAPPAVSENATWPPHGEQHIIEHVLRLSEITSHPGDESTSPPAVNAPNSQEPADLAGRSFSLQIIASDFKPQDSEPAEIRISIISTDELRARLDQRQSLLLQRLTEALRLQRTVHSQTNTLLDEAERATRSSQVATVMPAVELGQRRVRDYVNGDNGALRHVAEILDQIRSNRVADLQLSTHLAKIDEQLLRLAEQMLPSIEQDLGRAAKSLRLESVTETPGATRQEPGELAEALSRAVSGQDQVIQSIESLVDRLDQWAGYRLLAQEVAEIQFEQESLLGESRTLPTAARNLAELSAEEKETLGRMSDRQGELATRVDRVQQRLEQIYTRFRERDSLAAATLERALQVMQEEALSSGMREAAREIAQNRIGSATTSEEQVLAGLQRLHDVLSNRPDRDLARVAEQLRAAAGEAESLRDRQSQVAEQAASAQKLSETERRAVLDQVTHAEQELATAVQQLQQRLGHLQQRDAARALAAAAEEMRSAGQLAERGESGGASTAAKRAAATLEQVRRQLAQAAANTQQHQSAEQARLLADAVRSFHAAQQSLLDQTSEFAQQADPEGRLPTALTQDAAQLAGRQQELSREVNEFAKKLSSAEAFAPALTRVATVMNSAAERIADRRTDGATTALQERALSRLQRLLDAFRDSEQPTTATTNPQQESSGGGDGGTPERQSVAEWKVLHAWQLEINDRTAELGIAREQKGVLSPEQQQELAELTAEQSKLAEVVERLIQSQEPDEKPPAETPSLDALDRLIDPSSEHLPRVPSPSLIALRRQNLIRDVHLSAAKDQRAESQARILHLTAFRVPVPESNASPATATAAAPARPAARETLDQQLLDGLGPSPAAASSTPTPSPPSPSEPQAGEDLGERSEPNRKIAEIGRSMRAVESRLRERDTSAGTRKLQARIAANLERIIQELQQQQRPAGQQQNATQQTGEQSGSYESADPGGTGAPNGSGSGEPADKIITWPEQMWGVLPDRVREQMQNVANEEFLPQFSDVIQQYYEKLSERGKRKR